MKKINFLYFFVLSLLGCSYSTVSQDCLNIRISNVNLAIPSDYLDMDELTHPKLHPELKAQLGQSPGLPIQIALMMLDPQTFSAITRAQLQRRQGTDEIKLWLIAPTGRTQPPPIWTPERRKKELDTAGLEAFLDPIKNKSALYEIDYRGQLDDQTPYLIRSSAFDMPNPISEAYLPWRGIYLKYRFNSSHLPRWRELHRGIISRLESFIHQPLTSKESK
jgi:hypothetical protein